MDFLSNHQVVGKADQRFATRMLLVPSYVDNQLVNQILLLKAFPGHLDFMVRFLFPLLGSTG
jgi:hypothetical protein